MARVLVVDDDPVVRSLVCTLLRRRGREVFQACNGLAGVEMLERARPVDLVITDMVMPGGGGMSVLGAAKKQWPAVPVVAMSSSPFHLMLAEMEGVDGTLDKPIVFEEFNALVEMVLSGGLADGRHDRFARRAEVERNGLGSVLNEIRGRWRGRACFLPMVSEAVDEGCFPELCRLLLLLDDAGYDSLADGVAKLGSVGAYLRILQEA